MSRSSTIGQEGEMIARQHLEAQGYIFLEANWRCKVGEIDLIMQDANTRVFVEVRRRTATRFGDPLETIGWQKQQKLLRAMAWYQQQKEYWGEVRFDVIALTDVPGSLNPSIQHLTYAFS